MADLQIKNLEDLVAPILRDNKKYVGRRIFKLTTAGDNYGSLMLGVNLILQDSQGQREEMNLVAKLLPQNEFVQKLFNSQCTFRNEVGFYQTIAPCLRDFQQEQGLSELFESFPAFYGARMSLNPSSDKIDDDGVLLIKNIRDEGFSNIDRTVGFDLDQSRLILEKLAEMQATTFALKALKPEVFEEKLGCYFQTYKIFDSDGDSKMVDSIIEPIKENEFCIQHMDKIKNVLEINSINITRRNHKEFQKGHFLSFVHSDMWSNNIMVKIVNDKTIDVKFVDFQIYEYSSVTRDVVFFLYTSVQVHVIRQHCDHLLHFYYDSFINYLKKLKCDTSVLSFDVFIDDLKTMLETFEFFHIMVMLAPIYASQKQSIEVEELVGEDMLQQRVQVDDICKQKGYFIIQDLITRGWL